MKERFSSRHVSSDSSVTVDRFRAFVTQGVVLQVQLIGGKGGFRLLLNLKRGNYWLHTEKSQQPRVFSKAETAFKVVRDAGLKEIDHVELSGWVP
ncbi:MAG: hypothetical protein KDE64_12630 [Rhodocyclaceae bacterium]|nr:hypothetical protein [Rhodocyclaceae bacterium]